MLVVVSGRWWCWANAMRIMWLWRWEMFANRTRTYWRSQISKEGYWIHELLRKFLLLGFALPAFSRAVYGVWLFRFFFFRFQPFLFHIFLLCCKPPFEVGVTMEWSLIRVDTRDGDRLGFLFFTLVGKLLGSRGFAYFLHFHTLYCYYCPIITAINNRCHDPWPPLCPPVTEWNRSDS